MRYGRLFESSRRACQSMLQRVSHHRFLSEVEVSFPTNRPRVSRTLTQIRSSVIGSNAPSGIPSLDPPIWFSQPSVRTALHVSSGVSWDRCVPKGIFRNRTDGSIAPGDPYSTMPATNDLFSRMIEYTGNVIIGSGGLDMLVPTNGTLLVLQNVTWGGVQGFQQKPAKPVSC
jgi:hypothetical protein